VFCAQQPVQRHQFYSKAATPLNPALASNGHGRALLRRRPAPGRKRLLRPTNPLAEAGVLLPEPAGPESGCMTPPFLPPPAPDQQAFGREALDGHGHGLQSPLCRGTSSGPPWACGPLGDEAASASPAPPPPGWMTSRWCRPERAPKARPSSGANLRAAPADPSANWTPPAVWFASTAPPPRAASSRRDGRRQRRHPTRPRRQGLAAPGPASRGCSCFQAPISAAGSCRSGGYAVVALQQGPSPKRPGRASASTAGRHRDRPSRAGAAHRDRELVARWQGLGGGPPLPPRARNARSCQCRKGLVGLRGHHMRVERVLQPLRAAASTAGGGSGRT